MVAKDPFGANRKSFEGHLGSVAGGRLEQVYAGANAVAKSFSADMASIRTGGGHQPRRTFSEESLKRLAATLDKQGLIQPVLVRRIEDSSEFIWELVAGERRFRAAQLLGWTSILALPTEGDAHEIAMLENLQREDLNAVEEAEGLKLMMASKRYSQETLAAALGISQQEVSRRLSICDLPATIKDEYLNGHTHVPKSMLVEVVRGETEKEQFARWARAKSGMTIKEMREMKRAGQDVSPARRPIVSMLASADKFIKTISSVRKQRVPLEPSDRQTLEALRSQIDALLGE